MPKWCVVSCPPCPSPEKAAPAVAELLKQDASTTRQLLACRYPQVLACVETSDQAGQVCMDLVLNGVIAFVINTDQLETGYRTVPMRKLVFDPEFLVAYDSHHDAYKIAWKSIYLLIKGRNEQTTSEYLQDNTDRPMFSHLFSRDYSEAFGLQQGDLDYSCLGSQMEATTIMNFNKINEIIVARAPGHVLNDSLMHLTPAELIGLRKKTAELTKVPHGPADHLATLIYLRARYGPQKHK